MGLWNRVKQAMNKGTITSVPLPTNNSNTQNAPQVGNKIYVSNAQSWAPDLHPNGRENSQLVQDIDYRDGKLDVTYRDGFTAEYDNISPDLVKEFVQSDSKGRWAQKHLWDLPYKKV